MKKDEFIVLSCGTNDVNFLSNIVEQEKQRIEFLNGLLDFNNKIQSIQSIKINEEDIEKTCELMNVAVDETKQIAMLEERKKYCKNYLELKQIKRKLNTLKLKKRRK